MKKIGIALSFIGGFIFVLLSVGDVQASCYGIIKCTTPITGGCNDNIQDSGHLCSANSTIDSCANFAPCGVNNPCFVGDCVWDTSGGGGTTPTPTPAPSCDCGSQQCDYSIPTCSCQYIGCKTSTGASCVKYTCGSAPPPTPVYNPVGYHDSSYCDYSYGWTCDQDNYSTPLTVNFYKDGAPGTGTFIGSTVANVAAEAGVASACGGNAYHRFNFLMPSSVKDNISHTIYAQAVNIGSGSNVLLTNTPKTVTCAPVCPLTYPSGLNVTNQTPTSSTINWTLATTLGTSQLLRVGDDSAAVASGCPSGTGPGTGCVVKETLPTTTSTYNVTGLTPNTTYYYRIVNYQDASCYKDVTISALTGFAASWWQVKDSDVMASVIRSDVPTSATTPYFNLMGTGGFPGVTIYTSSTNLSTTNVSEKGWMANPSTASLGSAYTSSYFFNSVPSSVTQNSVAEGSTFDNSSIAGGIADASGYKWFTYKTSSGTPLNISSLSLGSEKVILLVNGANVNINGNINRDVGKGFFLLVTSGEITVNPSVGGGSTPNIEGIFISDGNFDAGTGGGGSDLPLWVRGTVASYANVILTRTMGAGNSTTAPYLFEYAPDLEFLYPSALAKHSTVWKEVAP